MSVVTLTMHNALPKRKNSAPSPYVRPSSLPLFTRLRQRCGAFGLTTSCLLFILVLWAACRSPRPSSEDHELLPVRGKAYPVVLVTVLDPKATTSYLDIIRENRLEYAKKHGYAVFFANNTDYDIGRSPVSWGRIPAMRHAMTAYSGSTYLWYLHQDILIMQMDLSIEQHVTDPHKLDSLMIKGASIVPSSIIKTSSVLQPDMVGAILAQDSSSLAHDSLILRVGTWAQYFLDAWFDPLYRSYNFEKAELHALEHILQWHPLLARRIAIVPQRTINAYSQAPQGNGIYEKGDIVVRLKGCETNTMECLERQAQSFLRPSDE